MFLLAVSLYGCGKKVETVKPEINSISESVYASGTVKAYNQYQAFANAIGIIENIYVTEGDTVQIGTPILSLSNEAQQLNRENAELNAAYADINANQGKLNEAKLMIELSYNKLQVDSTAYIRQKNLWDQQVGTKAELELRELNYRNAKTAYFSSLVRYKDLQRQLNLTSSQAKKSLQISSRLAGDFTVKSEINGMVYKILKSKGELVNTQTPLAVIGDLKKFILELQVDEYDIIKVKKEQEVIVMFDSYKGSVFEATVTKIDPVMNERSKTFLVEAEFVKPPDVLYPNMTFEANIILQTKQNALLIPRSYLLQDSLVMNKDGEKVRVTTGLKDYQKIEILSGITENDELIKTAP